MSEVEAGDGGQQLLVVKSRCERPHLQHVGCLAEQREELAASAVYLVEAVKILHVFVDCIAHQSVARGLLDLRHRLACLLGLHLHGAESGLAL